MNRQTSKPSLIRRLQAAARGLVFGAYDDYSGASRTRRSLSQYRPRTVDADSAYLPGQAQLVARSHDLVRNVPLAAGAINTMVTSVVGPGLRLQSRIDAAVLGLDAEQTKALQSQIEREFAMWGDSVECDVERTSTFSDMQDIAFRATLEGGDAFAMLPHVQRKGSPYHLKVQLVEGARVSNPDNKRDTERLRGGVERDATGAPVQYYFRSSHPGSSVSTTMSKATWTPVRAFGERTGRRNVLHLYRKLRPGQSRGVPVLAPVIEMIRQLGTYSQAEVDAAVHSAFYTVFVTHPEGMAIEDDADVATDEMTHSHGSAMMVDLEPGARIESPTPGRPNTAFDPFIVAVLRQIGAAIELPFELLIKHFTASYSASQAAFLEAWRMFYARRRWLVSHLCSPVLEAFMDEAVASGRIHAPGYLRGDPIIRRAYLGAIWVGAPKGEINEMIAANSSAKMIESGITNRAHESMRRLGLDYDTQVFPQLAQEEAERSGMATPEQRGAIEDDDLDSLDDET